MEVAGTGREPAASLTDVLYATCLGTEQSHAEPACKTLGPIKNSPKRGEDPQILELAEKELQIATNLRKNQIVTE